MKQGAAIEYYVGKISGRVGWRCRADYQGSAYRMAQLLLESCLVRLSHQDGE